MNNTSALTFPVSISRILSLKSRLIFKLFWIFFLILTLALILLYIFQVSSLANEKYLIRENQERLEEASKEIERLKIDLAKSHSREEFDNLAQDLGFDKIENIHYIYVPETRVVTK